MEAKDQVIFTLQQERKLLKLENLYLREQLQKMVSGRGAQYLPSLPPSSKNLPSLVNNRKQPSNSKIAEKGGEKGIHVSLPINKLMQESQIELERLQVANEELRGKKELSEKNINLAMNDNNALQIRLENLENVFIGAPVKKGPGGDDRAAMSEEYTNGVLLQENTELKGRIKALEEDNLALGELVNKKYPADFEEGVAEEEMIQIQELNCQLQERVEFLQKKERELMRSIREKRKGN